MAARVHRALEDPRILRAACRAKGAAGGAGPAATSGPEKCRARGTRHPGYCPAQRMVKGTCVSAGCGEPKWARVGLATRSNWLESGAGRDCALVRRFACPGAPG